MHIKKNILISVGILMTALTICWGVYFKTRNIDLKRELAVSKLNNVIFAEDGLKTFQEKPKKTYQEIDFVWDEVHQANVLKKEGRLSEAAVHYKRAFYGLSNDMEIITPGRGMAAFDLIDAYEKLGRYDDAIAVLDILDQKFVHGDYGIKKSADIRSRLFAAKNQATTDYEI